MTFLNLIAYGDVIQLDRKMNASQFVNWTENNFNYVKYNPRKDVNRYGLSITSLDGGLSGIPDLDSIYEYNKENGTSYTERDFMVHTPVFEYPELKNIIQPWENYIFRSHILKLGPGGFFPPHRDSKEIDVDSFRLIVPLENVNPPYSNFVIEDKFLYWEMGCMYFVNTSKMHYLFNASFSNSYWIVFNVECNETTVNAILQQTRQR